MLTKFIDFDATTLNAFSNGLWSGNATYWAVAFAVLGWLLLTGRDIRDDYSSPITPNALGVALMYAAASMAAGALHRLYWLSGTLMAPDGMRWHPAWIEHRDWLIVPVLVMCACGYRAFLPLMGHRVRRVHQVTYPSIVIGWAVLVAVLA